MKFSQVQDVEYLLNFFEFDKRLLIKFDNKIVLANSIKVNKSNDYYSYIEKVDINMLKYSKDDRFDNLYGKSKESLGKILRADLTKNELFTLKKLIDYCSGNSAVPSDNVLYNVDFIESKFHSSFLIVNPETDFEIIGLAD